MLEHDAEGPLAAYRALCMDEGVTFDPAQVAVAERLQSLYATLSAYRARHRPAKKKRRWRLFGGTDDGDRPDARGIYIFGGVGRGKTMLMDLFFDAVPLLDKRRVHYHSFMQEVHRDINLAGISGSAQDIDPRGPRTARIAGEATLLCFDEFHVTDIGDAMILGRLFEGLFAAGVIPVMTSNRSPDGLYEGGINRQNFVPFIELVKERMEVLELATPQDYRQLFLREARLYHTPLSKQTDTALNRAFERLTGGAPAEPTSLEVQGRTLTFEKTAKGVAVASFDELCARPLGAPDYLALEEAFHTLILTDIPKMNADLRNEAKRFVTLIDILYEHRVHLICAADAPPSELYPKGTGAFEFERTASRLIEMQSEDYVAQVHKP
jgi:cell division protein ZapE